jgi:hypothetical protein
MQRMPDAKWGKFRTPQPAAPVRYSLLAIRFFRARPSFAAVAF